MIPLRLQISGFLSYLDPVDVDFTSFSLACISGQNGAGKSSLLDAMTWALFGQARKRDESIINLQSKAAEVTFTFEYENNQYQVLRSLARGKTTLLEFRILDGSDWRPLTEHTNRDTQARIEQVLHLDYDTFINVSFFLQGRADQFAQQAPTRRKEILGNILGLETWETYKERTAQRRKEVETTLALLDGQTTEIDAELAEEEPRKARLDELETQLKGLVASRKIHEAALASVKQVRAGLDNQRELVLKMAQGLQHSQDSLSGLQVRRDGREAERQPHADLLKRASEVEADYTSWQQARQDLEKWDGIASHFFDQEKLRLPFINEINSEMTKLQQETETLEREGDVVRQLADQSAGLEIELKSAKTALARAETDLELLAGLEKQIQTGREQQAELRAENTGLKNEMNELSLRIEKLAAAEGAVCPLCGQALSTEHRLSTLERLESEGKQKGDLFRANKAALENLSNQLAEFQVEIQKYAGADADRIRLSNAVAQLTERKASIKAKTDEWEPQGSKRLVQVKKLLSSDKFALEARKSLARLDRDLAVLGYDAASHDTARQRENKLRFAEGAYRQLEVARGALKPLEDEIANLDLQISALSAQIDLQKSEHRSATETLAIEEAQAPDLDEAEQHLFDTQEHEYQLNQEVGAARQKVTVLEELRKRRKKLEIERGELGLQIGRYKALERAFGKDGVPALLIEQALPEIEMKANEILGRLSDDSMRMHFETQARYKDEKRKDLRETLEIQVSDGAGERDYELFSGGEAFRVNFAIRLALSEVLAQRKGGRLQMLVIDEGFGSQDSQGRQRLIQSINSVRADFSKILVITHLDELKDAFPTRIEVEKTERGSTVTLI